MNDRTDLKINRVHSFAICDEIGERLRTTPTGKPARLPTQLLRLVRRLDKVERNEKNLNP